MCVPVINVVPVQGYEEKSWCETRFNLTRVPAPKVTRLTDKHSPYDVWCHLNAPLRLSPQPCGSVRLRPGASPGTDSLPIHPIPDRHTSQLILLSSPYENASRCPDARCGSIVSHRERRKVPFSTSLVELGNRECGRRFFRRGPHW